MPEALIIPQVVTAIATLTGVVLTLLVSAWRERRGLDRQDAWKQEERHEEQIRWLRTERKATYVKFVAGVEDITRAIKRHLRDGVTEATAQPRRLVEIRASAGKAWNALNELRLVAPQDVVSLAEEAMFYFRDKCDEIEDHPADAQEMLKLAKGLLRFRKEILGRMRTDLAVED